MHYENATTMKNATYTMTKTAKGKQGFLYEIFNAAGEKISSRTSKRDYVAATACGAFFFGRLDLIGKGDHGRYLKNFAETGRTEELERYSRIAYLQEQAPATEPAPAQEEAPKVKAFGEHELGEEVKVRLSNGKVYRGVVHRYSSPKTEIDGLRRMLVIPAEDENEWHGCINYIDGTPIYPNEQRFSELVQGV